MSSDRLPDAGAAVLELRGVGKVYPGPLQVLRDIDLTISSGELLAIVGPSGSGKSTLLHIMGTLDEPTEGTIRLGGLNLASLSDREFAGLRARHIGFVFQQFFLLNGMSALDNVAQALIYAGVRARERHQRARDLLERVGLGHRLEHHPQQLSGGERQRVAIARALMARPSIVFADEPTGNLDTASGAAILALLRELNDDGTTIAVITHDRELAASLPRRVELRDGRIERDVSSKEITTCS